MKSGISFILSILLISSSFCLGQNDIDLRNHKIDSLRQIEFRSEAHQANVYSEMAELYDLFRIDSNVKYRELAIEIYKNLVDSNQLKKQYSALVVPLYVQYNLSKSLHYGYLAEAIIKQIGDSSDLPSLYNDLANNLKRQDDWKSALSLYRKALDLAYEFQEWKIVSSVYGSLSLYYIIHPNRDSAEYYIQKCLSTCQNYKLDDIGWAYLGKAGIENLMYHNLEKGIELQKLAIKTGKNGHRESFLFVQAYDGIARSYMELNELDSAIKFATLSYELAIIMPNVPMQHYSSYILANCYEKTGNLKLAHQYLNLALEAYIKAMENRNITDARNMKFEKEILADSIKNAEAQKVLDAQIEVQTAELKQERTQRYALYGGVLVLMLFGGFIFNRFKQSQAQKAVIATQKEVVEEAHKEITDSISYAKRIQSAILPPNGVVKEYLNESFILYKPKDVVAGDFYWMEQKDNKVFFAAADCTGHGVPGAMVSVICNNGLNRSVREHGLTDPGKILDKTREIVIQEFEKSEEEVKDGMDIALCSLEGNKLQFAGAHNPLWIIRGEEVLETKADKQPIGKYDNAQPHTTHFIDLKKGDSIYVFSDGYVDQFGGEKGKKFMSKNFKKLLLSIQDKSMEEQKILINDAFESWRGAEAQVDDVCVIGVRV